MPPEKPHLSDQELLRTVDGELSPRETRQAEAHLAACWMCRVRKQETETAIGEFVRFHRHQFDLPIPPAAGPRALLKAQIEQYVDASRVSGISWRRFVSWRSGAVFFVMVLAFATVGSLVLRNYVGRYPIDPATVTVPNSRLTPGATILVRQEELCREPSLNNKAVPIALQQRVFDEYGIRGSEPRAYEVDYLITPGLGGADDIHNLWPESRSATVWNSEVKDTLEAHLRTLVCDGDVDLATAQREIATNWIEAYKKYFHTDRPVAGRLY